MSAPTRLFIVSLLALSAAPRVASSQCVGPCQSQGQATLAVCPSVRIATPLTIALQGRAPAQPALLLLSAKGGPICAPFGKLCVAPEIFISPCVTNANRRCELSVPMPPLPPGVSLYFQGAVIDNQAPNGQFALSNGQKTTVGATLGPISTAAYPFLARHAGEGTSSFYIYRDDDDGLNHAKGSCWWGATSAMSVACACIDSPTSSTGCNSSLSAVDTKRNTVYRITWKWSANPQFAGISFIEATGACPNATTNGYNVLGARDLVFDARSPTNMRVNISIGSAKPIAVQLGNTWKTYTIPLSRYSVPRAELLNLKVLFVIGADTTLAPNGGTVLLDNVRLTPAPLAQAREASLPRSYLTHGVNRQTCNQTCCTALPNDVVLRNLARVSDTSLTLRALLWEPNEPNLALARSLADSLVYALNNENFGVRIPGGGLHTGYGSGDLRLRNQQGSARPNQAKLAGFNTSCNGPYGLIQDGASTRANAMATLALVAAHKRFGGTAYLKAARFLGNWIDTQPRSTTGFGGFHAGFLDGGNPQARTDKWTADNATVYAAFHALAKADPAGARQWNAGAAHAEAFLRKMYDPRSGRFNAGAVAVGTKASCGVALAAVSAPDVMNSFDWLEAHTLPILALAANPQSWIDLRKPLQYLDSKFRGTATDAGRTYSGYQQTWVRCGCSGGVSWELTAQVAAAMQAVDVLNKECTNSARVATLFGQIQNAQKFAAFGNGAGLVAASIPNGSTLSPMYQCLSEPFACVPMRVALAATNWAILAETERNPLAY